MNLINSIPKKFFFTLVAIFLSACSQAENPSVTTITAKPIVLTEAVPALTLQILSPTAEPSSTFVHQDSIIQSCISLDGDKQNLTAKGVLILETFDLSIFKRNSFLYDFDLRKVAKFPNAKDLILFRSISPDRKKLLYTYRDGGDFPAVIADSQGRSIKQFTTTRSNKIYFTYFSWLNVDTLRAADSSRMPFVKLYNYNPKTDHYQELRTDWPDVYKGNQLDWGIDAQAILNLSYAGANVVYDPTISRVVYPKNDENISLRDEKSGKELASIKLPNWGRIPRWSQNGKNLVLAGNIDESTFGIKPVDGAMPRFSRNEEFFIVSRDGGEFRQLTHLTDRFDHISIDDYAWSPDGQTIAFWLNTGNSNTSLEGKMSKLMLLDVSTGGITDLCIQGISGRFNRKEDLIHMLHPEPIWSPDGSQIMITQLDPDDNKKYNVLIVDLASKNAYKIVENLEPVGWMTKEP